MKAIITAAIAIASMAMAPVISAQQVDSVLALAERNNPDLRAAYARARAAASELPLDNLPGPTSVEYSPFFRRGVSGVASSELVVSQEFDFPTLYAARHKAADIRRRAIYSQAALNRRDILLAAKLKCIELTGITRQGAILSQRLAAADELLRLVRTRFDRGDATLLDLNRVKIDRMETAAAIATNNASESRLRNELAAICNVAPDSLPAGAPDYPAGALEVFDHISVEQLLEVDMAVAAARDAAEVSRREVGISKQQWLPSISIGYRRNTEADEASNGFLVGMSFPLFSGSRNVKAATARLEAARFEQQSAAASARAAIEADMAEALRLRDIVRIFDLELIDQTLALLLRSVELGNTTIADYYTEADRLYQRIGECLDAENRCQQLAAQLSKNTL